MKDNKDNKNKRNNSHNISYNKASGQLKSIASDTIKLATGKMTLLDFALTIPVKITKTALHTGSGVGKEIVNQVTHTTRPREYAKSVRDFTKQPTTPAEDFKNNLIGKQHRKDRYAKIIAESRATHQAILEKEQELYESICNPREWWPPKLINAIELEESPRAEPKYELTREVDCVYDKKGYCMGDGKFTITEKQWNKSSNSKKPANCNACRKEKAEVYRQQYIEGNCEECGHSISVTSKVWDMKRKNNDKKVMPTFRDMCVHCQERDRLAKNTVNFELVTDKKGLVNTLLAAKRGEHAFSEVDQIAIKNMNGADTIISTLQANYPPSPIDMIPLLDFRLDTHDYKTLELRDAYGNPRVIHVGDHISGSRVTTDGVIVTEHTDDSLRGLFTTAEEAIEYVHMIAKLGKKAENGNEDIVSNGRFIQVTEGACKIIRYDLDPKYLTEIVFKKHETSGKYYVATLFRPNHEGYSTPATNDTPSMEMVNPNCTPQMKLLYKINRKLSNLARQQQRPNNRSRRQRR